LQEKIVVRRLIPLTAFLAFAIVLIVVRPAWSQTGAAPDRAVADNLKYFDFFVVKGGWIAYLIIMLSVVAMALTIEHCISIRRATIVPPAAAGQLRSMIEEKRYMEALQFAAEEPSMIGHVVKAAMLDAPNGFAAMERAMDECLEERSAKLFRKIEYLNIIGAVSPMLGLFGTVVGMIMLFAEIHAADAFPRAQTVADNVAVALVTTFWGLAVAIPSLSVYAVFRNRIDVLASECALESDRILSVFKPTASRASAEEALTATVAEERHAIPT
jgi:biopolymer transport protein ExbB